MIVNGRLVTNIRLTTLKKYAKSSVYASRYGDEWVLLSRDLREKIRKCQWCDKKQRHLSDLAGHHIGCVQYNYSHLLDKRIIIIVCRSCHELLEPWSKVNLDQLYPQIFEQEI